LASYRIRSSKRIHTLQTPVADANDRPSLTTPHSDRLLVVAIERKSNTRVKVTYALDAVEFNEVQRVVNTIFDRHG
jgi:hypothetical protein